MLREGLMPYWWSLFRHSRVLGQRTDVFRNIEDAYALKQSDPCLAPGRVHVDIGSGSSPVPTLLYVQHRATTYATEFDPVYMERQNGYARALRFQPSDSFHVKSEDATRLSFRNSSVDLVTAISTIEHIPNDGDISSMAEFVRVLRPGGRVIVTVPASPEYIEAKSTFYYSGFERRYSPAALASRLHHPGLKLIDQLHMVSPPEDFVALFKRELAGIFPLEKNPTDVWYQNQWHEQYADVSILMTLGLIRLSPNPEGSFGSMLTFEKE